MKRILSAAVLVGGLLLVAIVILRLRSQPAGLFDSGFAPEPDVAVKVRAAEADDSSRYRTPSGRLVEVELVFFQDKARRAVTGLVVHSDSDGSLIAVESSAGRCPESLPAVDRVWVTDREGRRHSMEYLPCTEASAETRVTFYRVDAVFPALPISDRAPDLKPKTSLVAVTLELKPNLEQRERIETIEVVRILPRELTKDWRLQRARGKFEQSTPALIEMNRPAEGSLAAGTPLFLNDECVGVVIDTAEIQGPERPRLFALFAAPIKQVLPEIIKTAATRVPPKPTNTPKSPTSVPPVIEKAASDDSVRQVPVSLIEALLPIMLAAEKEAEQPNATEDQKLLATRYRETRERLGAGLLKEASERLSEGPEIQHPSLDVVSWILGQTRDAKDWDSARQDQARRDAARVSLHRMDHCLVSRQFDEVMEWIRFLDSLDDPKYRPDPTVVAEMVNLDTAKRERTTPPRPIDQLVREFHSQLDEGELKGLGTLVGQALRQAPNSAEAERMQLRLVMRLAFLKPNFVQYHTLSSSLAASFVSAARRRLALGEVEAARLLATDALPVNLQFRPETDTPGRVLADIQASRPAHSKPQSELLASTRVSNDDDVALDREAKQLAARVRVAKEPEKSKLRDELEKLTEKHFEHRQQRRASEISELADRVDKLRVAQHRRQESKADIVKRRVADLLDTEKDLRWDEARIELPDGIYWFRGAAERSTVDGRMEPIVKKLQNEGHRIEIIDVDRSLTLAKRWKIDTLPTFLIVNAGKESARLEANQSYEALKSFVARRATSEPGAHPIDGLPMPGFSEVATPKRGDAERTRSTEDAKKVATAALVRAAEARRKLAELIFTKAEESNKKVPGTIPGAEIERLKANLEIANAELDAAKAGVDISRTDKPMHDTNAEPTYKGTSLNEWLRLLENERNPEKLAEAVVAVNFLAPDAEPRQLVRATLRIMQAQVTGHPQSISDTILYGSVGLLCLAKSELVVEQVIAELHAAPTKKLSLHFRTVLAELFHQLVHQTDGPLFASNVPLPRVLQPAVESLRKELRRNWTRLVMAMVGVAQRDPSLRDWLVGCTPALLSLGEQPLSAYSELIPQIERTFVDAKSEHQLIAARLLGSSQLRVPEVLALAESWLSSDGVRTIAVSTRGLRSVREFEAGIEVLAVIGPHSPQAVTRLTKTLQERWSRFADLSGKPVTDPTKPQFDGPDCVILIEALGRIGEPARGAIPLLREIEQSPASESNVRDIFASSGFRRIPDHKLKTLRALVTASIQQIENVKPKPKTDSRTDEN